MELNTRQPFTFDRVVRIVIALVIVAALGLLIGRLKGVLLPFLVAWLIAYLMNPLVEWNQRLLKRTSRALPILLSFVEIGIALSAIIALVVPMIVNETQHLYQLLSAYVKSSENIPVIPVALQDFLRQHITLERISTMLSPQEWGALGQKLLQQTTNIVSSSLHGIFSIVSWGIVILYIIFILIDYHTIIKGFGRLIPSRYRSIVTQISNDVKDSMNRYFRGQALIATINGVLHAIGFLIIGLPMAIPMGILVGVLNMIPYMQILSYPPALLLCIIGAVDGGMSFWLLGALTIAVFLIAQVIQEVFLTPRIMGDATGLNPAIILLSLSVWGSLLGFVGLIIALPLTSLLLAYYKRYIIDVEDNVMSSSTPTITHEEPEEKDVK